ncbi:peptidoglycan DD-metalloendopeptidase family protein [Streptomyces sp. NBC_00385]|uniref:peptidoglycan DD-metalloendopeptidase family protein n=1 Tax=Streptomyces sp. NBC_00385 TaxID=2975733 RepID=UPI002DD7D8DE|nr:peptidoglycan DD-metalloendopeptidase family protein [Streptomyces sp. NBC_00385]WRZ07887.1 peptidoglycan DD-metalloendopeptidase family protein [Streptomyces sp. NBC_00385]
MPDLDIVGGAAVDVVPVIPQFHTKLKAMVLPVADKVGEEAGRRMGEAISRNIVISIPQAINQGGKAGVVAAGRQGDDAGGAFARSIRRKLEVAFKALPKADVRLGDTGFNADLARLRARMETLRNKTVGVDVSAVDAEREIVRISAELERLGATHMDVNVRADTATARAALAAIRAEIAAIDAKDIRIPVRVDTSQASSALMSLGIQVAALAAIPLGPALAAGLGAVVTMAAAAGAGVGALALAAIPAVKSVTEVIRLKTAAEDEATNATSRSAATASQAASKAIQLASAQSQLASAHRNAAKTIEAAERAVAQAQRAVADAAERAGEQREAAADGVRRAEQSLVDAQRTARQAEQDLTRARADAAQQLKALNDQLTDGALDQREATLRVAQAQEDLNAVMADPKATKLQQEAAQLALDRARQGAKEQAQNYEDLKKSAEAQRKAGVDGSDAVKAATDRVGEAQRTVADQTEALAKAHEAAAKAQRDGARSVADAQVKVADAVRASADAQVSAADSVASAQRGLASAQLSSSTATGTATTKAEEYRKALAKLTPAGRDLFNAVAGSNGLTSAFKAWSTSLQPHVLPIFTRGVNSAKATLPGLTPLVLGAAAGIQTLMDKASAQLKTPFWVSFKQDLKKSVEPAVVGFGVAFGNVIKGMAGVIDAFLPHMNGIAKKSDSITGRFAKWGSSLKGSPKFEKFLQYVKDTAPGLASFIGDVLTAALDVSKAAAPLSTAMMAIVGPVFKAISSLATNNPELVQALWAMWAAQKAIALGMVAFSAAMAVYQSVMLLSTIATAGFGTVLSATGILPIIRAVLIVVGLLVAGFVLAYTRCDWFRTAVDAAWAGITTGTLFLWNVILKPTFTAIWTAMQFVGSVAMWLWINAFKPAFDAIATAAQFLFTLLTVIVLLPIMLAIKATGAVAKWLWDKAFGPTFKAIGDGAMWLWNKAIKPAFGFIAGLAKWLWETAIRPVFTESRKALDAFGSAAKWLWTNAIKPVFGWIADRAKWLWDKGIKPSFDLIKDGVDLVVKAFKLAKEGIKLQWDALKDIAKKPVKFIIDHVYNKGILPLWNGVAKVTGAGKLNPVELDGFATGGIMSGYSPGRDDRVVAVGGGEAIMRPEWTRAVGADKINEWNAAARSGGIGGVQRAISNGMPAFKDGGIVDWVKDKAGDAGDFLSGAADFLDPTKLSDKAKKLVASQMKPYLTNPWAKSVAKMPTEMLTSMKDKAMDLLGFGGGGEGGGGSWIKPVDAPFGTRFGKSGSLWSSGHHTGLDFPAAVGTAIKAVADGKVSQATSGGPYGIHAMLNHGGGLSSMYAHMSKILMHAGDNVKQGQVIGRVGATGNVTGPHLHLEARLGGRTVDPMQYLTGGGGGGSVGSGVQRWRGVVNQALRLTGNPSSYANVTLARMQQESGGNPRAVNNWDTNARSGYPSTGLMQVIRPTFQSYAGSMLKKGPFLNGVSIDPLANVYSSMRYAKAAYGNLGKAYGRVGGYAGGGFPPVGEWSLVGENGPELAYGLTPTQVMSNHDSRNLFREAAQGGGGRGGPPNFTVENHVWVGDREITDIVDARMTVRDAETGAAIEAGRYI